MTIKEAIEKLLLIFPHLQLSEDNGGQLIVYTNMIELDGKLVELGNVD